MKKHIFRICALTLLVITAHARDKKAETWQENPKPHATPAAFLNESAVFIEDNTLIEYKDGEDKEVYMYTTSHRIIKVLDDKGIESFNKVSVPVYAGQELKEIKARTILPNGTILEIPKDKMKVTKNDEGDSELSFAMDGVEKNAEVELLLCYKKQATFFGRELFQFSIPVAHSTFELTAPARLKFEEKGYYGYPAATDTVIDNTQHLYAETSNIPPTPPKEIYANEDVYRMMAAYKLSYLPEKSDKVRVFTWQDLAKRIYSNIYDVSDKENKAVEKFIETLDLKPNDKEEDKIKKIESAIKSGITLYKEINDENAWKLDNVISKKSATETGIIRLFAACFVKTGVKHELGTTTSRSNYIFDVDFENWNVLDNYVFYFPDQKKFLSPAAIYYRYPFTTTDVITNKGMFCKLINLGDISNAVSDIRTINPVSDTESNQNISAVISFTPDMDATAEVTYSFRGYCAMGIREGAVLLDKDKQKQLAQEIINIADKPENIIKYAITGEAFDNYYTGKPIEFTASVKTPQLVEKAGTKYLFRIGDVIGRQSELYQTQERKYPIDVTYPHHLGRTIVVHIPDGYKILNADNIKIHTDYKDENGKATCAFYSDYKIEGNKLTVTIDEFYAQLHYPVSGYEPFRKVINASADFNKVTLLLDKVN